MLPRLKPQLSWRELAAAWLSPHSTSVVEFEEAFAALMGVKQAVVFPYGRTGLFVLLRALGFQGREIICPAYTCVVVPHAIVTSGNEPVFVDSQPGDYNMNLDLVEQAVNEKTAAIIATSVFGYPVDLDKLRLLEDRYPHIVIIQDCAHSFAAQWGDEPVQRSGEAAIFGLNISKLMTSIYGGMVTTDNPSLAGSLRRLRADLLMQPSWKKALLRKLYLTAVYPAFSSIGYSFVNYLERAGVLKALTEYYQEAIIDMPQDYLIGLTSAEAEVGKIQVAKYHQIIAGRRRAANFYNESLADLAHSIQLPPLVPGATYSHYVPKVTQRSEILSYALRQGVQLGQLIEYCIPEMPAYAGRAGNRFSYPVASDASRTAINLPVWSNHQKDWEKVSSVLHKYYQQARSRRVQ